MRRYLDEILLLATLIVVIAGMLFLAGRASASSYTRAHAAVCAAFGPYCAPAMRVVACETGRTYKTTAHNGQYLGLFQMGSSERARYGHGRTARLQARAAYRYFVATGRDWSPWSQCSP